MDNRDAVDRSSGITPAAPAPEAAPPPEVSPTLGEWLQRNFSALLLLGAVLVFSYYWFGAENLWSVFKVILGLGLVIFIHELGHFAVAKWCDVHVETFSIGFGPALPGCKFQYGETTYMVALVPLGGYVKMVGESPDADEGDDDPRSFKNKSVWQRMAIISAGVLMNVFLAILCFIIVFRGPGKKQPAGVVGMVVPGQPAWEKGVPSGAWIHQIGSKKATEGRPLYFTDLLPEVMLSHEGEDLVLVYTYPPYHKDPVQITLQARKSADRPLIGVSPADCLKLTRKRDWLGSRDHPVLLKGAAARAEPAFAFEDLIIGCTDPAQRQKDWQKDWTPLPRDERDDEKFQPDFFVFSRRLQDLAGKPITVRVRRATGEEVSLRVPAAFHFTFGLKMHMGQIADVRNDEAANPWKGNRKPVAAGPSEKDEGDVLEQVEVVDDHDKVTRFLFPSIGSERAHRKRPGIVLDPTQLRFQLQQWAAKKRGDKIVTLRVRRSSHQVSTTWKPETLIVRWDESAKWKYTREVPSTRETPLSIPELGIAYYVMATVAEVDPKVQPGLKKGDRISQVRFYETTKDGEEAGKWQELKPNQWAHVSWLFQHASDYPKIGVRINDADEEILLQARPDKAWPLVDRGLLYGPDIRMQKADSIVEAVQLGMTDTYDKILQVYKTLRGFITNRISTRNLGGPITIARAAFNIAGENFWEFIYFLGLISINLAVVNFLPIPVLDGGHMVFLIYEKIRGKPASERVRVGAAIVGVVLLVSLMIFVSYLDISKIVKP